VLAHTMLAESADTTAAIRRGANGTSILVFTIVSLPFLELDSRRLQKGHRDARHRKPGRTHPATLAPAGPPVKLHCAHLGEASFGR